MTDSFVFLAVMCLAIVFLPVRLSGELAYVSVDLEHIRSSIMIQLRSRFKLKPSHTFQDCSWCGLAAQNQLKCTPPRISLDARPHFAYKRQPHALIAG